MEDGGARNRKPLWKRKVDEAVRCRKSQSKALCEPGLAPDYSPEDVEFLRAVDDFRRRTGRVPTLHQGFLIAKVLGWRKVRHGGGDRRRWLVCDKGHLLTDDNVQVRADGRPRCRTCQREHVRSGMRRLRARAKAAGAPETGG